MPDASLPAPDPTTLDGLNAEVEQRTAVLARAEQAVVEARQQLGEAWLRKGRLLASRRETAPALEAFRQAFTLGQTEPDQLEALTRHLLTTGERDATALAVLQAYASQPVDATASVRSRTLLAL